MPPPIKPTSLNAGKVIFVDSVYGNDATAQRQSYQFPFLTLSAAKTSASSGDLIIVGPGTYNEINLLKTGVNWYFERGAIVNYTGNSRGGIFDDGAFGANAAISCSVGGYGRFNWYSTFTDGTGSLHCGAIWISNVNSAINFEVDTLDVSGAPNATTATGALFDEGTNYLKVREIIAGGNIALWWNRGACRVDYDQISATGDGLAIYTDSDAAAPTGAFFTRGKQVKAVNSEAIQINSLNATVQTWNEYEEAISTNGNCVQANGGKNYFTAQKTSTASNGTSLGSSNPCAAFYVLAGKFYATSEKIAGRALYAEVGYAPEVYLNAQLMDEDTGATDSSITIAGTGTHTIRCDLLKTTAANGINVNNAGATIDLTGRIDTSAAATKNPVLMSTNGSLRLRSAVLISNGARDSIETSGGATPTVLSYGTWAKTDVDAAVAIVGDFNVNASFT